LQELSKIIKEVGIQTAHFKTNLTKFPYITFRETTGGNSHASGIAWRETTSVALDHFTKAEYCKTLETLKKILLKNKINYTFTTIWYEQDEIIHTAFDIAISRDLEVLR